MKNVAVLMLLGLCGLCQGAGGGAYVSGGEGGSIGETEDTRLFKSGQPVSFTCEYNLTSPVTTVWKKDDTEVVGNDHVQLFPNSTLYIAATNKEDIGEYTCQTSSQAQPKTFYLVELTLQKPLPKSTTVLENDKLSLSCQVKGEPLPTVQWLRDGEPVESFVNSSRLQLSQNENLVENASLRIDPVLKSDGGSYVCLISQYSLQLNTTTEVRVKDIYAALWPFLGIVAEVIILCTIIFIYEKRRIRPRFEEAMKESVKDLKKKEAEINKEKEVRQRKQ